MRAGAQRLTWRDKSLRPYESGWSVFRRVCRLNALESCELAHLIAKIGRRPARQYGIDFTSSTWIDFDAYAQLLGSDPKLLRQGFLDQLGLPAPSNHRYEIRHCPECKRDGFHCTLFDLAFVSHCPWHRIALSSDCLGSDYSRSAAVRLDLNSSYKGNDGVAWEEAAVHRSAKKNWSYTPEGRKRIGNHCRRLVAWIRTLRRRVGAHSPILSATGHVGRLDGRADDFLRWQFDAALSIAGTVPEWCTREPATRIVIVKEAACPPAQDIPLEMPDPQAVFKSIRRQVLAKNLSGHVDCLRQLSRLPREGLPALHSRMFGGLGLPCLANGRVPNL